MNNIKDKIKEFTRTGNYHEIITLLEQEIEKTEKEEEKYHLELKLAESYYSIREFSKAKAIGEKLSSLIEDKSDHILIGDVENLLGKIYRIHQRYDEALSHYENAKKSFKLANHKLGLSKIYHNIGNVYVFLGQFKESLKNHQKALDLAQQEGVDEAIASSYLNIGGAHFQNGQVDKAADFFNKAKDLFDKIGDEPSLAAIYLNLAETNMLRREYKNAIENSQLSKNFYTKQQNTVGQKLALTTLGKAEKLSGLYDDAIETFNTLMAIEPDRIPENIYFELGECLLVTNQKIKAKEIFEKILELPNRTQESIGYSLDSLARIAIELNNYEEAKTIYSKLVDVLNNMEPLDKDSVIATQANLGFVLLKTGDFDQSWKNLETCTNYFRKKKNLEELITFTNNYRDHLLSVDDYQNSISVIKDFTIPALKKLSKDKNQLNQYNYEVALLYNIMGKNKEALTYQKKNIKKKNIFLILEPSFLQSSLIEQTKRDNIKKHHISFLKAIQDEKNAEK